MKKLFALGALLALVANNEIITMFLLVIAAGLGLIKLFSAAAERSW